MEVKRVKEKRAAEAKRKVDARRRTIIGMLVDEHFPYIDFNILTVRGNATGYTIHGSLIFDFTNPQTESQINGLRSWDWW